MVSPLNIAVALTVGIGDAVLAPVRPGPGPATERWGVGFGELAAGLPKLPGPVRTLARQFNRLGSVVIGPTAIEYDGDKVDWDQVSEIRARRLVGYLVTGAITKQVGQLPVWRFPGRGLVLDGLSGAALTALALAAELRLDRGVFTLYVPAEVHYRGLIRSKDMTPGVAAALVLANPAVRDLVESTATAHGVSVRMADDDALEAAVRRAAAIRAAIGGIVSLTGQAGTRSSA